MALGKKTGGRTKGTPNKATASVKAIAQNYGSECIDILVSIARDVEAPEAARVGAVKEILDRGYGKARQPLVGGEDDEAPIQIRAITEVKIVGVRAGGNPDS